MALALAQKKEELEAVLIDVQAKSKEIENQAQAMGETFRPLQTRVNDRCISRQTYTNKG